MIHENVETFNEIENSGSLFNGIKLANKQLVAIPAEASAAQRRE
jgi:hypothetical protein